MVIVNYPIRGGLGEAVMNTYLPHIIGVIFFVGGFIAVKLYGGNKSSENQNSIQSCWIDHVYKAD